MKTYLELEVKLGTQPCTSTYPLDKNYAAEDSSAQQSQSTCKEEVQGEID